MTEEKKPLPVREREAECADHSGYLHEYVPHCSCPFFHEHDGERECTGTHPDNIFMSEMTRQEMLDVCPLKKENVLVRLKEK